jgi:hypothetical protein
MSRVTSNVVQSSVAMAALPLSRVVTAEQDQGEMGCGLSRSRAVLGRLISEVDDEGHGNHPRTQQYDDGQVAVAVLR